MTIRKLKNLRRLYLPLLGLFSLLWFLIRVIPKPSRATYPCQRAAFPIATGFIIWISGIVSSAILFKKARFLIRKSGYVLALFLLLTAIIILVVTGQMPGSNLVFGTIINQADTNEPVPVVIDYYTPRNGNLSSPVSQVAIVQSKKNLASEIDEAEIEAMIREAVGATNEFDLLVNDNMTVVIKPNIVSNTAWTEQREKVPAECNGMVTDWRVIKAVIRLVREQNPQGKVYLLEGSADNTTRENMSTLKYLPEFFPGLTDIIYLEEQSGSWEDFGSDKLIKAELPIGKGLYPDELKPGHTSSFFLNRIYYEADVLISVPVLKNHSMTSVTGAVKNVGIGATPQNIYGGKNGNNHRFVKNRIDHRNYTNLHKFIHDFYLCRPVDYAIMDGLQGLENGPVGEKASNLQSIQKNCRLILAGKDPLAVDAIESLIMCYDPSKVKHLVYLHNDRAGCIDPRYIRVLGPDLSTIRTPFLHFAQTEPMFTDTIAPIVSIRSVKRTKHQLKLNLDIPDKTDILKAEVEIGHQKLTRTIVKQVDHIRLDLPPLNGNDSLLVVKVYDRYLNCRNFRIRLP